MQFKNLEIRNFRNFENLKLDFSSGLNIFLGNNGQGKTNLLEALYLLNQKDSFRYGDNETLIQYNKSQSILSSQFIDKDLDYLIQLQILKTKKNFLLNGKKISVSDLRKSFSCVIFSPESLSAIKEASDDRRKLIDEAMLSILPQTAQLINDFRRALKTRNRVLKDQTEGLKSKIQTIDVLESLDPIYLKLCIEVTNLRIQSLIAILNDFNIAMRNISNDLTVDISVEYLVSNQNLINSNAKIIDDALHKRHLELRDAELAYGASLIGPHKHDISFLYNQKDSRFFCSQGQQRAIILSFKMAQIVYHKKVHGKYPVLMLDDVLSELDENKRNSLIQFLHDIKTQIFITSTDLKLPEFFQLEDSSVVEIERGQILNIKQ